jgi:hypothetical protein
MKTLYNKMTKKNITITYFLYSNSIILVIQIFLFIIIIIVIQFFNNKDGSNHLSEKILKKI